MDLLSAEAREVVNTEKKADEVHNALLLRNDIHALFDDYQWSIWVRQLFHILGHSDTLCRVRNLMMQGLSSLRSQVQ
jgi:hypothetical protein